MKNFMLLIVAGSILAGCAIVPVAVLPGVYVPVPVPAFTVRPYGYGHNGYYGDPRYRH
jgi:hypothetical protein